MTTEIAIMNKSAVALAADSAVTITVSRPHGNTDKVRNSANKLFALSKYNPIGLMVYGNASLLGIPWETIVKIYRHELHDKEFMRLEDYSKHFFNFLDNFDIDEKLQDRYVATNAYVLFTRLKNELDEWFKKEIIKGRQVDENKINNQLSAQIKKMYKEFLDLSKSSVIKPPKRSNLRNKYRKLVEEVVKDTFGKMPLTKNMYSQLLTIVINAASVGPMNQSGIVIAGFGKKDLFPQCYSYDVAAVFAGHTIKRDGKPHSITHDIGAAIIPFAQSDDVHTFMQGIGPRLWTFLQKSFYEILVSGLPDKLHNEIGSLLELNQKGKTAVRSIAKKMCEGAYNFAFKKFREQQNEYYVSQVLEATGHLNKSELAAMAETLVNLVSFRKQVTMEAETVGGPIDVAVITKGDGLIWIKRKHYFNSDLNPHFVTNYYRKGDNYGQNK